LTMPCKIWPDSYFIWYWGGLDRKGRKVGYWCVTVAATRGGSLSIAVQPWLKGNSTHKQEKGELEGSSHKITEGRATKQEKKKTVPAVKRKRSNTSEEGARGK